MEPDVTTLGRFRRCLLVAAVLSLAACEKLESGGAQTFPTGAGTITNSGIQDEVTIGGNLTVSGSAGD